VRASEAVRLVARREISSRAREKSFLLSTGFTLVVILAVAILPALLGSDEARYRVAFVTGDGSEMMSLLERGSALAGDASIDLRSFEDEGAARAALEDEDVDAVVEGEGSRVLVLSDLDPNLEAILQGAAAQAGLLSTLRDADVPPSEIASALDRRPLTVDAIDPPDPDREEKGTLAFIGSLILYGQIFTYGFWVAMGVVEEKSSRVVEIVLSKITPAQLLGGKVIGIGLLGFGQLLLLIVVGLGAASAAGTLDIPSEIYGAIPVMIVWFAAGFAFYSCAFAVAGALVSRQEELQSTTTPLSFLLIGSFFLAIQANNDPGSMLATISSFVPFSAPLTMPQRMLLGEATWVMGVLSLALTCAAAAALIPLAGRAYRGAVLRVGAPVKLREAWRAGT
jgi:ABC-2 type transport system permease protein